MRLSLSLISMRSFCDLKNMDGLRVVAIGIAAIRQKRTAATAMREGLQIADIDAIASRACCGAPPSL
jgi:hypothetical protein